jgi:hypothetical protein
MIDLSTGRPPRDPARMSRRHLLVAGLCGLAGGAGGAWAVGATTRPGPLAQTADTVAAVESAAVLETFVDLATIGPAVTVTVDRSTRYAVTVGATIAYGSSDDGVLSQGGAMSFEATGANRMPPSLTRAARSFLSLGGVDVPFTVTQPFASTTVLAGLEPGRTTFTAKYRAESGSPVPVFFSDRTILITPLAAEPR